MNRQISRIGIVGGGRWSRVLLSVLDTLLPEGREITWISRHGQSKALKWARAHPTLRLRVSESEKALGEAGLEALLVASSPQFHCGHVRNGIELGIPTLCEKPIVLTIQQAEDLAETARRRACP